MPRITAVVPLPGSGARLIARIKVPTRAIVRMPPRWSTGSVVSLTWAGTRRQAKKRAIAASGALMMNTDHQSKPSSSAPATSGPSAEMPPPSADHRAIDLVRVGPRPEGRDQRQGGRVGHAGGDPAEDPGEEEDCAVGASGGEDRGRDRQRHPQHQQGLAAVAIADRAEVEDRRRQPERVADRDQVDHRLAGVEVLADVRQGDVRHRQVQVGDPGDADQRRQHERGARGRSFDPGADGVEPAAPCRSVPQPAAASTRPRSRYRPGRGCAAATSPTALAQPQASWMWPKTTSRGRFSSTAASSASLPKWVSGSPPSQWPFGGEWRTSTQPSGAGAIAAAASSSERSKLQSQGVVGIPAPRPKNSTRRSSCPRRAAPSPPASRPPRRAARRPSRCCRGRGSSASRSAPAPRSSPPAPRGSEAKSPAPITTSASADISTSFAAWPRSRCRSEKASSFTPANLIDRCAGCRRGTVGPPNELAAVRERGGRHDPPSDAAASPAPLPRAR